MPFQHPLSTKIVRGR